MPDRPDLLTEDLFPEDPHSNAEMLKPLGNETFVDSRGNIFDKDGNKIGEQHSPEMQTVMDNLRAKHPEYSNVPDDKLIAIIRASEQSARGPNTPIEDDNI